MKQPSNPAAEAIEKLNAQNAELLNLRIQTEQGNKDYCDRLNAEIASNESIIAMLEPNAEWTEEQPTA